MYADLDPQNLMNTDQDLDPSHKNHQIVSNHPLKMKKNGFQICTKVILVLFPIITSILFAFVNLLYDSSTLAMNLVFPSSPTTETMSLPSCGGHLT